jgi:hypothetical protein
MFMKSFLLVFTFLFANLLSIQFSSAVPGGYSEDSFPDFRTGFNCTPLFNSSETTSLVGRIGCARANGITACVVGENYECGTEAAWKLANEQSLGYSLTKNTLGALVIYGDRGVIAGTTKGASRAQQYAISQRVYKNADGVVIPAEDNIAGRFAKGTLLFNYKNGAKRYVVQDSNFIVGKDLDNQTSFYAIVTPGGEYAVVKYIRSNEVVELKCYDVPESLIGGYLAVPGIAFLNN